MEGHDLCALADQHGTPLHVASARTLRLRCDELTRALAGYGAAVRIHFSYKTNRVASILRVLHARGLGAEVVDGYELWLADQLGVPPDDVVFNGPNKSQQELRTAIDQDLGLLVVDGLDELTRVQRLADELGRRVRIGLRVCPDVVPKGVNTSSMTGSRRNQFGLDLKAGEADEAIRRAVAAPRLELRGLMAHIGSGIHDLGAWRSTVGKLLDLQLDAWRAGAQPDLLDLGGGLGTRQSREFTTLEMLTYLGTGRLPRAPRPARSDLFARYGEVVAKAVTSGCRERGLALPTLVLEPGRALTSDAQVLLLRVGTVRQRPGIGTFALTDGGAMTVSMMFLSEYHAVLLANRAAPRAGRTSIFGRLPSPMDVVYRNMPMPALQADDVLAVMDAGAYFTSTATNFGGPRPGVVLVDGARAEVARRREIYEDLARLESGLSDAGSEAP